jgi:hypothetical protein
MRGRAYLELARELVIGGTEVHWRGTVGRAYYALMLEGRDALFRWGFMLPRRDNVHTFVRLHFTYPADVDLKKIGAALDIWGIARNRADYDLSALGIFASAARAQQAIADSAAGIDVLDAIEADATRRAAAIAAIKKAFP